MDQFSKSQRNVRSVKREMWEILKGLAARIRKNHSRTEKVRLEISWRWAFVSAEVNHRRAQRSERHIGWQPVENQELTLAMHVKGRERQRLCLRISQILVCVQVSRESCQIADSHSENMNRTFIVNQEVWGWGKGLHFEEASKSICAARPLTAPWPARLVGPNCNWNS